MTIVPETRLGKIQFYQVHLPVWGEDPASIGLSAEAVTQLQALLDEAQAAYEAHSAAQQAALTATQKFHNAVRKMHAGGEGAVGGAALLQQIKVYAQSTSDNSVYDRAQITPPSKPGRPGSAPVPGTPYNFTANLTQLGEIELTWKCDNPDGTAGTVYQVQRQLEEGPMVVVGTVGEKKFRDATIPAGTRSCTWRVTALRSTGKGEAARYFLQFGATPSSLTFTAVRERKLVA